MLKVDGAPIGSPSNDGHQASTAEAKIRNVPIVHLDPGRRPRINRHGTPATAVNRERVQLAKCIAARVDNAINVSKYPGSLPMILKSPDRIRQYL